MSRSITHCGHAVSVVKLILSSQLAILELSRSRESRVSGVASRLLCHDLTVLSLGLERNFLRFLPFISGNVISKKLGVESNQTITPSICFSFS